MFLSALMQIKCTTEHIEPTATYGATKKQQKAQKVKLLDSKQLTKQQRAQKGKLLDSKLFASLLHNWRDGRVMHMAR